MAASCPLEAFGGVCLGAPRSPGVPGASGGGPSSPDRHLLSGPHEVLVGCLVLLCRLPSPRLSGEPLGTGPDLATDAPDACSAAGEPGRVAAPGPLPPFCAVFSLWTADHHRGKDGREAFGECGHPAPRRLQRGFGEHSSPSLSCPFTRRSRLSSRPDGRPSPGGRLVPGLCSRSLVWNRL